MMRNPGGDDPVPLPQTREVELEVARIAAGVIRMIDRERVEADLRATCDVARDPRGVELFQVDVTGEEPWLSLTATVSDSPECPELRFTGRVRAAVCTCGTLWVVEPRYVAEGDVWRLNPMSYPRRGRRAGA